MRNNSLRVTHIYIHTLTSEVYQEYAQALSCLELLMLHHHLARLIEINFIKWRYLY